MHCLFWSKRFSFSLSHFFGFIHYSVLNSGQSTIVLSFWVFHGILMEMLWSTWLARLLVSCVFHLLHSTCFRIFVPEDRGSWTFCAMWQAISMTHTKDSAKYLKTSRAFLFGFGARCLEWINHTYRKRVDWILRSCFFDENKRRRCISWCIKILSTPGNTRWLFFTLPTIRLHNW